MELKKIETNAEVLTLLFDGELDSYGSKLALKHIDEVIFKDTHREIEIDLSKVAFLDSSGVGAIVYFYKRLIERERKLRLNNVTGQPLEIFNLLRIGNAIPINKTH